MGYLETNQLRYFVFRIAQFAQYLFCVLPQSRRGSQPFPGVLFTHAHMIKRFQVNRHSTGMIFPAQYIEACFRGFIGLVVINFAHGGRGMHIVATHYPMVTNVSCKQCL